MFKMNKTCLSIIVAYLELNVSWSEVLLANDGVVRESTSGVYGVSESLLYVGVGGGGAAPPASSQVQRAVVGSCEPFPTVVVRQ